MNTKETSKSFQDLKLNSDRYISRRNSRLLVNHKKEMRNFTRAEATSYLDIDPKTLERYLEQAGIDPRRHEDAQWSIDISEMYKVRDLLSDNLRKEKKFIRSPQQKLQVKAIQNQKGGVGKTTTAVTVASGFATEFHQQYRIGLIDLDGQSTASMYYAAGYMSGESLSVGDLIMGNFELDEGETLEQAISEAFQPTTIPNLRILPSSQTDRALEGWFHEQVFNKKIESPYSRLKQIIDKVSDQFDVIFIDTPPSLGYATYNAYFAATSIIFPLSVTENDVDATCSYFSYIPQVWALLENAGHPGYDYMKILLTNYRESYNSTDLLNKLEEYFGKYLYSKEFKHSEAIRQCSSLLSTVFDMSKGEYPKTKTTFMSAQQNAFEVTSQIMREAQAVWRNEESK